MATIIDKAKIIADWAMKMYDKGMEKVFDIRILHAYYSSRAQICEMLHKKHLKKSEVRTADLIEKGFKNTIGEKKTDKIATRCIHHHAFLAFCVTTICTLPESWIMWPAMIIDIIFFQYEQFAVSQELETIYSTAKEKKQEFTYDSLAVSALKMSGVLLKSKIQDTAKKAFSTVIRNAIKRGSRIFRGPAKGLLRQGLKWACIILAKEEIADDYDMMVDQIIDISVIIICALIAGFVSYWLFVPMAKRLQQSLIEENMGRN